ncbi:AraC family transcriptional regulator [Advenella mimigardefordensis]|uniref:Transcriptional regulator, AraC family n=1 Tax=Advenella mimigardefordensis (strain DSM 17166 / LMG 22922 / DPN7) TaxID=1247726 RepID=W0PIE8_ADVMD|nr:AraC family transcriptional regulator [Advenella mimigardefordensis]AHG65185.1 transcriptional regulator, AraC family [Advenella mimigardefordensis DPN7]
MSALAQAINAFAQIDGDHATPIAALSFHRRQSPTEPLHCVYGFGLGVVVQGAKQVTLADRVVEYGPGQCLLATMDLPVFSCITQASQREPFLGLMLALDAHSIVQMATEMQLLRPEKDSTCQPVTVQALDNALTDALIRLVNLLNEPALAPRLAPLIQQEITIRLLTGPHGPQLLHLVAVGSPSQKIARAVTWLKQNYTLPMHVDELAAYAGMGSSTFRHHFRAITGMSPLQFQKQLRLQQARQLMLNQNLDAGHVGGLVGYESASQFNREYSRLFGEPPHRDVRRMRVSASPSSQ